MDGITSAIRGGKMMKKTLSVIAVVAGIFLSQSSMAAKEAPDVQLRTGKTAEDQKFYQEVNPLITQWTMAVKKEDGSGWLQLCNPKEGITFRYLGKYTTKLTCPEWKGLFQETKSRWWGRSSTAKRM